MGRYTAIADVTAALVETLSETLADRPDIGALDDGAVAAVSPADVGDESDVRLGFCLLDVTEHATLANDGPTRLDETRHRDPPLALSLQYLLTAYPASGVTTPTTRSLDQQRLLGVAMQVLAAVGTLEASQLPDDLGTAVTPQLSIVSRSPGPDVWSTFPGTDRQPSVRYRVGPVLIDAREEVEIPPVTDRRTALSNRE